MRRILVVGMSGAGKTTAARALGERLVLTFHEMDTLALGPGWSTPPDFVEIVSDLVAGPEWVIDSWGYPAVRDVMWAAADTIVWLDYPRWVVLPRVLRRSIRRTVTRQLLFGGNRETLTGWFRRDHPAWHAVTTFSQRRAYLAARTGALDPASYTVVRLRRPADFDTWSAGLRR